MRQREAQKKKCGKLSLSQDNQFHSSQLVKLADLELSNSLPFQDEKSMRDEVSNSLPFQDEKSMRDAIEQMNGQNLDGCNITVDRAQSRGSEGGGGAGGYNRVGRCYGGGGRREGSGFYSRGGGGYGGGGGGYGGRRDGGGGYGEDGGLSGLFRFSFQFKKRSLLIRNP